MRRRAERAPRSVGAAYTAPTGLRDLTRARTRPHDSKVTKTLPVVVEVSGYSHDLPFAGLLQDALALRVFEGSNDGVRRRQLNAMVAAPLQATP